MAETSIHALNSRLQKQVESARTALDRNNPEYAINICVAILSKEPGCLGVRRLLRAAQLKIFRARNRVLAKGLGTMRGFPALLDARSRLKKEPARAMESAEKALGADPTNQGALRVLAEAALAGDFAETAVFALESLRDLVGERQDVTLLLGNAYVSAGRSPEALVIAERLLRSEPGNANVQELIKRASVEHSIAKGRWDSGSGSYRDKLRDEQRSVLIEQSNKVVTSEEMTQRLVDDGIAHIAAEPRNLNHFRTVVGGLRQLGRFEEALEWLARARELPAAAADATLEKLESELRLGRIELRIADRQRALGPRAGDAATDTELSGLQRERAQLQIADLRALSEKFPSELGYRFDLGQLLQAEGNIDQAIQHFQTAQRAPRYRLQSLAALGGCFKAKGQYDLAVQQLETAKQEMSSLDDAKKDVLYQLATCFEAMGRGEAALAEYKTIYSADISFRDVAAKIDRSYLKG